MTKFKKTVGVSLVTGREFVIYEPIETDEVIVGDIDMHRRTVRRVLFGPKPIWQRENLANRPTSF